MTSATDAPENPLPFRSRSRRAASGGAIGWLRANLFSSIPSSAHLAAADLPARKACVSFVQWGYWNAIWTVPGNQTNACRAIRGLGACWAVIPEKYRFILFGTYPFGQQWRPAVAILTFHLRSSSVEPARAVAQGARAGVGRSAGRDWRADVGRHLRAALCFPGSLGRATGDADPRNIRTRLRLSARDCRRARPAVRSCPRSGRLACSMSSSSVVFR